MLFQISKRVALKKIFCIYQIDNLNKILILDRIKFFVNLFKILQIILLKVE